MRILGRAVQKRFAAQSNLATFASSGWVDVPFYALETPDHPALQDDPLLGAAMHNPVDAIAGVRDLPGGAPQLELPLDLNMFGHVLRMAFGAGAASGSNPNHIHTFTTANEALPAYSIQARLSASDVIQMRGCVLDRLSFEWRKQSAYARARATFQMRDQVNGTGWLSGSSAAALADARLNQFRASATWGGSALGDLLGFGFDLDNRLSRYETLSGDEFIAEIDTGLKRVSGTLTVRHRDNTLRGVSLGNTTAALAVEISSAADATNRRLTLTAGTVRLTALGTAISGPDGVDQRYNWQAEQTSVAPALTAVLRNGQAQAVYGY